MSAFYQRNLIGMVLRRIETNIPSLDDLKLPEILKKLSMTKRGLVLFVGGQRVPASPLHWQPWWGGIAIKTVRVILFRLKIRSSLFINITTAL